MSKPSILFLQHEFDRPLNESKYVAAQFIQPLQQSGYKVTVARGVREKFNADLLFAHVDSTTVEPKYLEYMSQYPVVINGRVTDISKHRFSTIMLQRTDSYQGRVIVKTKANFGGHKDLSLLRKAGHQPLELDLHQRPWRKVETLDPYDYPVFESLHAVPAGVWKNPKLIVEKFCSEKNEDSHYVIRNWFFLGDQGFTRSISSPYQIVKPTAHDPIPGRETCMHQLDEPLHPAIQELRQRMGFDYGRFDYVMVDGEPVVFDTNTTPVTMEESLRMFSKQFLEDLPKGLLAFI